MDDPGKFANIMEYRVVLCAVGLLVLSECLIFIMTSKGRSKSRNGSDKGSVWLIIIGWYCSMIAGAFFRSQDVPEAVRNLLLPHISYYIGVIMIAAGIVIRCTAVVTLKKAFTLSVQTTDDQRLIKTGLYHFVRNPAYTGSMISLLGVALAYRHILGAAAAAFICIVCYGVRISIEEKALRTQFKEEFKQYCDETKYRLIPKIY